MVDPHAFMDALREFHHSQGEDLKAPIFNRRVMDLEKLWELVFAHGGSQQVCLKKRWASIGRCFNPPASMTNLSFHIKRIFERYLLAFEQFHFPGRAMKSNAETCSDASSSISSCTSPMRKPVETIFPAFDRPIFIPKKRRSKLTRQSKYRLKKQKRSGAEAAKGRQLFLGRTINPKEFAMPQTLMRPSTALSVNDCEIQAASALQQMKAFPTLSTGGLPPAIGPPSFLQLGSGFRPPECPPLTFRSSLACHSSDQNGVRPSHEVYLSNGIRVIPIKPSPDGFFPISIVRPSPELRPTSLVIPPSEPRSEPRQSVESQHNPSREIERLQEQVRQMKSVILRQESKIQAAESSFAECRNCFQAIVAKMRTGVTLPVPTDTKSSAESPDRS